MHIKELFKDTKALVTDLATLPVRTIVDFCRAGRAEDRADGIPNWASRTLAIGAITIIECMKLGVAPAGVLAGRAFIEGLSGKEVPVSPTEIFSLAVATLAIEVGMDALTYLHMAGMDGDPPPMMPRMATRQKARKAAKIKQANTLSY